MAATNDNDTPVDRTPNGSQQNAALPSGEVFGEFGVVDLNHSFPADEQIWRPEDGAAERHVVVPFRVVQRGFKSRRGARKAAERMEDEEHGRFTAVQLSDSRGL